jgi:hypothetical protein
MFNSLFCSKCGEEEEDLEKTDFFLDEAKYSIN